MNTTKTRITAFAAAATMAVGGMAGIAQAKHGADDPAGHQRHGNGADDAQPHAKRHHARHHHGHHHQRHGADDGPNHT
jgi:Ni/Co efflux regulator RcnB